MNLKDVQINHNKLRVPEDTPIPGKTMETFLCSWIEGNSQMDQRWFMPDSSDYIL